MANAYANFPVTVWQVSLVEPDDVVAAAAGVLSADETARAARFVFERDRHRFILARAALRHVLADCLGLRPAAVRFSYSSAGKPALDPALAPGSRATLAFNLSHSHELALIAVTHGRELGVDIEYHRELPDLMDIARRFFSPREAARLLALAPAEQPDAFFRCWTRKEAYLKARGDGIVGGLDRFDVSFEAGAIPAILSTLDDPSEAARWSLLDLVPAPHYAGAVAVTGPRPELALSNWTYQAT